MKKLLLPIIALLTTILGLVSWNNSTYSATGAPLADPNASCAQTADSTIKFMRETWLSNLNVLLAQEKPTSEKVDEAFQSYGTYRCWLDYLCEDVLYSTTANPKLAKLPNGSPRALSEAEIPEVPGCMSPEKIEIPDFQLEYMPACSLGDQGSIEEAHGLFAACRNLAEKSASDSFVALNDSLTADSGGQKVRPLQEKFSSILLKMLAMEGHMATLKKQVLNLDARTPCYCAKCD